MHTARLPLLLATLLATAASAQLPPDSLDRTGLRGYSIGIVDSAQSALAAAPSLAHALQARLPGVSVSLGQGLTGSDSRVWLRGPSGLVVNEPLLIIDGARTHTFTPIGRDPFASSGERDLPSRLEDIDMETVERIEVLRGPSASAIYGPAASKGVILVTTKRGHPGPARWRAFAESGLVSDVTDFPANFGTVGISSSTGEPAIECPLAQQASGMCVPVSRQSWNPLQSASPFRAGAMVGAGLTVSGGAGPITYFLAGTHDRADGVYRLDHSGASSARVSLSAAPVSTVDIHLTGGHRTDRQRHPAYPWIQAGLFGNAADDSVRRGYSDSFARELKSDARDEVVERMTFAFQAGWRPRRGVRISGNLGYDRLRVRDDLTYRYEQPGDFPPFSGWRTITDRSSDRPETRTGGVDASVSYRIRGTAARSSLGVQYVRDHDRGRTYQATFLENGGFGSTSRSWFDMDRASTGLYLQQHAAWFDRLFVTGSLRGDRPVPRLGLDAIISHSVDAVVVAIDSTCSLSSRWLSDLRLRAAYGHGGDHIVPSLIERSFGQLGLSSRAAERRSELEIGADASLLSSRARGTLTWYRGLTTQGLEPRYHPQQFSVLLLGGDARVRTSGVESSLDATLVASRAFTLDAGVIFSAHRNRIVSLGGPPFQTQAHQRFAPGGSIGRYYAFPYTYADANGDGLLERTEVVVRMDQPVFMGSPFPEYEAGLRTTMTFGRRLHLSALLDRRSGAELYNLTARLRCRTRCEEQHDPATSIADQSRAVAAWQGGETGFFEDASYTKLREVRAAVTLPGSVARFAGASAARLTVTGRNLYTWTEYGGLDPEVVSARYDAIESSDNFFQPTVRSLVARLDLTW